MDIMGLSKESVSDSRDTLYNQMIVKYNDAYRTLGITADCQPFLILKDGGGGDNAKQSREETYLCQETVQYRGITLSLCLY